MFFIPIVAGWALGVTSAKLADNGRQKYLNAPSIKEAVKASRVGGGIKAVQKFKEEKIDAYIEDSHGQSQKELSLGEEELSVEEQIANQILKSSTILLASTSLSALLYPPLLYLHIPPMLYMSLPFYKQGFKDLFERRKVTFTQGVDQSLWSATAICVALKG